MATAASLTRKWRILLVLAFAELLIMSLWFSASAVVPQLRSHWGLGSTASAWLTMSVQLGFVAGALGAAITNLTDRVDSRKLIVGSALLGAFFTTMIAALDSGPLSTIGLRFCTGICMAGVYPPGMRLVATWCRADRGLGIGILVGAITFGSASPHLLNAVPFLGAHGMPRWETVLYTASASTIVGAALVAFLVRSGPELPAHAPFRWSYAGEIFAHKPTRLANFGYFGHMWELYAMWTWCPLLLLESYRAAGWDTASARIAGFAAVASGAVGSILAGKFADRFGRTLVTIVSLAASGGCALVAGFFFDQPGLLTAICVFWGFAAVADSAQFSAAVSELVDPRYVGTALTVQTSLGFLLTVVTIQAVPAILDRFGWGWGFASLAIGPAFGIWSMATLRSLPESLRLASGKR